MIDGIIKADGTSRLMRATLPATYDEFKAQAAAGTLPIDVLFNESGWSQMPTFLNKANLLKDVTAALFGFPDSVVPDNVLAYLGRYAQHWWKKYSTTSGYVTIQGTLYPWKIAAKPDSTGVANVVQCGDRIEVNASTGALSLSGNVTSVDFSDIDAHDFSKAIAGKYIITGWKQEISAAYVPADPSYTFYGEFGEFDNYITVSCYEITAKKVSSNTFIEYVRSSDKSAYPENGTQDGFLYEYLGIPFQNAVTASKIATGSYTGTGKYGSANKNSLTFNFKPKMLILLRGSSTESDHDSTTVIVTRERTQVTINTTIHTTSYAVTGLTNVFDFSDTTITWYMSESVSSGADIYHGQFNESGKPYYYIAVG